MQHAPISRARYVQENRKMRFLEAYDGWNEGRLTPGRGGANFGAVRTQLSQGASIPLREPHCGELTLKRICICAKHPSHMLAARVVPSIWRLPMKNSSRVSRRVLVLFTNQAIAKDSSRFI
jgi:hypothetical protein